MRAQQLGPRLCHVVSRPSELDSVLIEVTNNESFKRATENGSGVRGVNQLSLMLDCQQHDFSLSVRVENDMLTDNVLS